MTLDNMSFLEHAPTKQTVSVLGVPIDLGKDNIGTDEGADHLRKYGLSQMFANIGVTFEDLGNVSCPTKEVAEMGSKNVKYMEPIAAVCSEVAAVVDGKIRAGNKMVVLGGDHSLTMGTVAGAAAACDGDIGLIYIDAHGDIMTHENTLSGNVHGMPVAALLGFGHPSLVNIYKPGPKIKTENVVFVGLKDLDQGEIDIIRQEKIHAVTMLDILQYGFQIAVKEISELQKRVKHIWVSLDLDSIDSQYAPATPILNQGGLSYREVTNLAKYIGKACNIVGFDIVELAPHQDVDEKTTKLAVSLIAQFLGAQYSWYTTYMDHEVAKQVKRSA